MTSATAPPPCSPPWISSTARSSGDACSGPGTKKFIRFLNTVARDVPADKTIHVVLDNYATHKHPKVRGWLARHPRVTFHFTPTSCSWANAVEGWFARLTRQRLKRGVFTSIVELQTAK
jgi:transposase